MSVAARMLEGKKIHPDVSVGLTSGSRQVVTTLLQEGIWQHIIQAGVRVMENVCGPCIGMGFSPVTDAVSLRTFNRNFLGRSGTKSAGIYLCSPETAVAAALTGEITDPRNLGIAPVKVQIPASFPVDDSLIMTPGKNPERVEIIRGPNIKPLPLNERLPDVIEAPVLLKVEDDITTDHIMPAGAKILPLRSNVPKLAEHVFEVVDETFAKRARQAGKGFIVGGANYGQGSSREHAALAPMALGVKAVITQSFARIHLANLVNFGIIPITFKDEADYDNVNQGDILEIDTTQLDNNEFTVLNKSNGKSIPVTHPLTGRDLTIVRAGGALAYAKAKLN